MKVMIWNEDKAKKWARSQPIGRFREKLRWHTSKARTPEGRVNYVRHVTCQTAARLFIFYASYTDGQITAYRRECEEFSRNA